MAKKVEIVLTHAQAEALCVSLQSITKQTNTVSALTEIVTTASDVQVDDKKVTLALPASKAAALAKALPTVPKQTKTVERLTGIVAEAISAYDQALADDSASV